MRISDWSSDVCSSDLKLCRPLGGIAFCDEDRLGDAVFAPFEGRHGFFLGATHQHLYDSGRPPLQFRVRDNNVDHLALIDLAELQHDSRREDVYGGIRGRATLTAARHANDLASRSAPEWVIGDFRA